MMKEDEEKTTVTYAET